ncbi:hypothetical protein NQ318_022068 [Aromia moschata]|uniref:Uncharacterized protein n=1 Tax=Aromia moschata TaxID=1265417 RepID=A0AAV8Z7D2_9CUCU|nr:hypothetical protein NQ318_022068 [Aromia moschata]
MESDVIEDLCVSLAVQDGVRQQQHRRRQEAGHQHAGKLRLVRMQGPARAQGLQRQRRWLTSDGHQRCKCKNGLSLCSNVDEQPFQLCFKDDKIFRHLRTGRRRTAVRSHLSQRGGAVHLPLLRGKGESDPEELLARAYPRTASISTRRRGREKDDCTSCTCVDGESKCTDEMCDKSGGKKSEMPAAGQLQQDVRERA